MVSTLASPTETLSRVLTARASSLMPLPFSSGEGNACTSTKVKVFAAQTYAFEISKKDEWSFLGAPSGPGGMPLSAITVGALADLGYVVNPLAADPYRLPATAAFSRMEGEVVEWEKGLPIAPKKLP